MKTDWLFFIFVIVMVGTFTGLIVMDRQHTAEVSRVEHANQPHGCTKTTIDKYLLCK